MLVVAGEVLTLLVPAALESNGHRSQPLRRTHVGNSAVDEEGPACYPLPPWASGRSRFGAVVRDSASILQPGPPDSGPAVV